MKLYLSLKDRNNMKLTIINIQFMEWSKVVLENLQYLPLLQLHSPFQLVVLDGRIVNFHLHTKNYNKQFKLFTCAVAISYMIGFCHILLLLASKMLHMFKFIAL